MRDESKSEMSEVTNGASVTLHFSLSLADGTEIDSNFATAPATFRVGDGNLLPGFEQVLLGARSGDSVAILLPAVQAFGEVNPDNVQSFPRQRFAGLLANTTDPVEPGTVVSFVDAGGNEIPGVLKQIGELSVVIDFNHPLAGRDIMFKAHILSVVAAGVQPVRIQG